MALDECEQDEVSVDLLLTLKDRKGELMFHSREVAEEYFELYSTMCKTCLDPPISIHHQLEGDDICFAARLARNADDVDLSNSLAPTPSVASPVADNSDLDK